MKLSVYSGIVELFRSLRYNDFAIQNVAQKYPEYVYDLVSCHPAPYTVEKMRNCGMRNAGEMRKLDFRISPPRG